MTGSVLVSHQNASNASNGQEEPWLQWNPVVYLPEFRTTGPHLRPAWANSPEPFS